MTSVQGCDARVAHGIDERRHTGHRQEEPTKILALRGGAVFWPRVISESFGNQAKKWSTSLRPRGLSFTLPLTCDRRFVSIGILGRVQSRIGAKVT